MTTTRKTTRKAAAESINATIDGEWVYYYDDATSTYYRSATTDLDYLAELIDSDDPDIAASAYSHWCNGTDSEECVYDEATDTFAVAGQ